MKDHNDIRRYWFGELGEQGEWAPEQQRVWFGGGPEVDRDVTERFGALVEEIAAGGLQDWAQGSVHQKLAYLILCDQLTRNIWRGSARAFSLDDKAFELSRQMVEADEDLELHPIERVFVYLPFEHREDLDAQHQSMALFTQLAESAPESQRELFEGFLEYAERHAVIIEQFGRYPHRNELLGRETTEEEAAWLVDGERFGQ